MRVAGVPRHAMRRSCRGRKYGVGNSTWEFLHAADKRRSVRLLGTGEGLINPLSAIDMGHEVARSILSASNLGTEKTVGGPETFTHRQIAELAFRVLDKPAKIRPVHRLVLRSAHDQAVPHKRPRVRHLLRFHCQHAQDVRRPDRPYPTRTLLPPLRSGYKPARRGALPGRRAREAPRWRIAGAVSADADRAVLDGMLNSTRHAPSCLPSSRVPIMRLAARSSRSTG